MDYKAVKSFLEYNFRHFNAASLVDASKAYTEHIDSGGKMLVTFAGAMSTAELGLTLAEMIREDKLHAICCTGANLEEDIFNLVAHKHYRRIKNYRDLTPEDEARLRDQGLNRVTDTCIPEEEAMRKVEAHIVKCWKKAASENKRFFPYEYFYQMFENAEIEKEYQIDPKASWLVAAYEKQIPIFVPGWEDSTLGNMLVALKIRREIEDTGIVKSGLEQMEEFVSWYKEHSQSSDIGFFQIGGGIAGDFPICAVPLIKQDLKEDVKYWSYFCQISDSTTSYGSYSGAVPNEKISWCKLDVDTPSFIIESDASIVAPLVFAYVLAS